MTKHYKTLATLGPLGYLPAPGTVATIVTLALVYVLQALLGIGVGYVLSVILLGVGATMIVQRAVPSDSDVQDPREIVVDEVIGTLVVFIGLPLCWCTAILGVLMFRIFDIFKPCGIAYAERCPGAWGIMLDDIAAGLLSAGVLWLLQCN